MNTQPKTVICKNCGNEFTGNYCNMCGQTAHTHDINLHFIWHDIQHGLLHFEKGILYTIKELFIRPGHAIKEYIDGKRINHFKPLSLLLLLGGLYAFLLHTLNVHQITTVAPETERIMKFDLNELFKLIEEHFSIAQIILLPVFSFASYLAFKRYKLSYMKHVVLNAFMLSQRLVIKLLFIPFLYAFNGSPKLNVITGITNFIGFGVMFWTMFQFFNRRKVFTTILRCVLYLALFFTQMAIYGSIIVIIVKKFF